MLWTIRPQASALPLGGRKIRGSLVTVVAEIAGFGDILVVAAVVQGFDVVFEVFRKHHDVFDVFESDDHDFLLSFVGVVFGE